MSYRFSPLPIQVDALAKLTGDSALLDLVITLKLSPPPTRPRRPDWALPYIDSSELMKDISATNLVLSVNAILVSLVISLTVI